MSDLLHFQSAIDIISHWCSLSVISVKSGVVYLKWRLQTQVFSVFNEELEEMCLQRHLSGPAFNQPLSVCVCVCTFKWMMNASLSWWALPGVHQHTPQDLLSPDCGYISRFEPLRRANTAQVCLRRSGRCWEVSRVTCAVMWISRREVQREGRCFHV